MKKGVLTVVLTALFVSGFMLLSVHSQEDMEVVDPSAFTNPQRTAAVFKHDAHNEKAMIEDCSECHHVYEDGKKVEEASSEDQRCSDCHGLEADGKTLALVKAFHTNCKGCHVEQKKGPIMCGECHVR